MQRALILGSGGREAMLTEQLTDYDLFDTAHVTPGNGGTMPYHRTNIPIDRKSGYLTLLAMARDRYDLIVSGSEEHLMPEKVLGEHHPAVAARVGAENVGLADIVRHQGHHDFFGVSGRAAMLEGSKMLARNFMEQYQIPTPQFITFRREHGDLGLDLGLAILEKDGSIVVKADGLAGGKGVGVVENEAQLREQIERISALPNAQWLLLEERLHGIELSATAVVGENGDYVLLPFSQDHKPAYDEDKGPNTGGMGALTLDVPHRFEQRVREEIIEPTIRGAIDENRSLEGGVLYAGLMVDEYGEPKVLEYNTRFGDPETQVILPGLRNTSALLWRAAKGQLAGFEPERKNLHFATVVLAAKGYPGEYSAAEGRPITGFADANSDPRARLIFGGTQRTAAGPVVKGSRNVNVLGAGRDPEEAVAMAYRAASHIKSDGLFHRSDIGLHYRKTMEILRDAYE